MGLSEADLFALDKDAELPPVPSMERPYISDCISFENDIKPYPFILLWSGIGSGKNTFVEHMVNGCSEKGIPKLIVLLITSRKSKVLETLDADDLDISNRLMNAGSEYDILLNTTHHQTTTAGTLNTMVKHIKSFNAV